MSKNALSHTRQSDYAEWYQQVIKAADMAENAPVRGCMVIKPWGYALWEALQREFDTRFKATGHQNAYFPLFIPLRLIEKEAKHVEGFAKEMAVVTHHRLSMKDGKLVPDAPLEEPLVVRPTSETIIGEVMANWVQSYRDLPLLLNQWCNIVRWEMRPRIFLRTAEFLWQEGHTAHATQVEAEEETMRMLEIYREVVEDIMAVPIITGEKSEGERFPGAVRTYCIEAMMQDGKALQAGTSHYLGQNFAKAAGIRFQTKGGELDYVHTTSWGVSTRLIGGLIMTHADDIGLKLPPRMAPVQAVIVPIARDETDKARVHEFCTKLAQRLVIGAQGAAGIRVQYDQRDLPSVDKRWQWVRKGVPLILEVGPRDVEQNAVTYVRRDRLEDKKVTISADEFAGKVFDILEGIQKDMFAAALSYREARTRLDIRTFAEFQEYFKGGGEDSFGKGVGFVRGPWCGEAETEALLKPLAVTVRCLPLQQGRMDAPCLLTGKPAVAEAIFARSY